MDALRSGLVDIVRDFLITHQRLRGLFEKSRAGTLKFAEVEDLVSDQERSVLFRLKERCHRLFRADLDAQPNMRREALFDLTVGSLFHEAMKLRENMYQREIYAPRVGELRGQLESDSDDLFREFEKILAAAHVRLSEALLETEALLEQTRRQLLVLLRDYKSNTLIARFLIAKKSLVEQVFEGGLDRILADIYGEVRDGYVTAAHSYLDSAYFSEALDSLATARKYSGSTEELTRLECYAEGMQAFLSGRYGQSLGRLGDWVDAGPMDSEARYLSLAQSAASSAHRLANGRGRAEVRSAAVALLGRLNALAQDWELPRMTIGEPASIARNPI